MTLTKQQTDDAMKNKADDSDKVKSDIQTETRVRQTSSTHPIDCQCSVCLEKRRKPDKNENQIKDSLNYYKGDSHG